VSGARVARERKGEPKTIAGVPVLDYHLAYGGDASMQGEAKERWVVVMKEDTTDELIGELCSGPNGCEMQGHPSSGGLPIFEMTGTEQELEDVLKRAEGQAEFVEPDREVSIPEMERPESESDEGEVGTAAASWGLTRVGVSSTSRKGRATNIYVFDTGIRVSHNDFGGRAIPALDVSSGRPVACNGNTGCAGDVDGHGTHCAGSAAGTTYGVAKQARVYAIKVLSDQGSGSWSWSYAGLDWMVSRGNRPFVASMSLGGGGTLSAFKTAIDKAVSSGVVVVVAAGNENDDACKYTPAFVPNAISVGSTTSSDSRSSFSNFGKCTNIWAPGSSIVSASQRSNTGSSTLSGTSMACPHVAGAAALRLGTNPGNSPSAVRSHLLSQAQKGRISGLKSSDTNAMLFVGY
jgi:subtilisin family serine protease